MEKQRPIAVTSTQESSLIIMQTGYNIASQANYYDDPNFHNLIFGTGTNYWLASRGVNCASGFAYFGLRYVYGTNFSWYFLFYSYNYPNGHNYAVRPVVSLPSTVELKQVPGTNQWDIVKK